MKTDSAGYRVIANIRLERQNGYWSGCS